MCTVVYDRVGTIKNYFDPVFAWTSYRSSTFYSDARDSSRFVCSFAFISFNSRLVVNRFFSLFFHYFRFALSATDRGFSLWRAVEAARCRIAAFNRRNIIPFAIPTQFTLNSSRREPAYQFHDTVCVLLEELEEARRNTVADKRSSFTSIPDPFFRLSAADRVILLHHFAASVRSRDDSTRYLVYRTREHS